MAKQPKTLSKAAAKELLERLGVRLSDTQWEELRPDLEALARNIARLAELELSGVEPATTFQAEKGRWQTWRYTP